MAATVFIGGGNMASALVGGIVRAGGDAAEVLVVEPDAGQRERLEASHGVATLAVADASIAGATMAVWAVKPQAFADAARACTPHLSAALQLSVMAGIRSSAIVRASGSERVVRAMPNTPALIGEGIAALYARPAAAASDRERCQALLGSTGQTIWVEREASLDAVTALSGSGPAYVFYLLEAMMAAGEALGLTTEQARRLAIQTVRGSAALAAEASETPAMLRARVTSKGGTTHAAMETLDARSVRDAFVAAITAAEARARALGDEFDH